MSIGSKSLSKPYTKGEQMSLKEITTYELFEELRKRGFYVLLSLTVADVQAACELDEIKASPEEIAKACEYVAREWEDEQDFYFAVGWAVERITETKEAA